MTEEIVKEEKTCECPFCKIVKCECCKKLLVVIVGSFIGCALAILLFAPKPPKMPCHRFMYNGPMMERQLPPPAPFMYHREFRGEFRGDHRPPLKEFRGDHKLPTGEFRHKMPPQQRNFRNQKPELPPTVNED